MFWHKREGLDDENSDLRSQVEMDWKAPGKDGLNARRGQEKHGALMMPMTYIFSTKWTLHVSEDMIGTRIISSVTRYHKVKMVVEVGRLMLLWHFTLTISRIAPWSGLCRFDDYRSMYLAAALLFVQFFNLRRTQNVISNAS